MKAGPTIALVRLRSRDADLARATFALMAEVFGEQAQPLPEGDLMALLAREDFWVLAALADGIPVGGITAHAIPMTRAPGRELFLYDLAVHPSHQRQGVGRALVERLRMEALAEGIRVTFVAADEEDTHALAFYRALGGHEAPVRIFTLE